MPDLQHPEWVAPLVLGLLATCAALLLARVRARRRLARLLDAGARVVGERTRGDGLLFAALVLVAVALVGVRIGTETVRIPATGSDLVILLDVSRSMAAADTPPSRMQRAHRMAAEVLRGQRAGDRAALAAFAGRGALLTPLTPDEGALLDLLPAIGPDLMSDRSSRLELGIEAAMGAFDPTSARPRTLLVISDGEHASDATEPAKPLLAASGVRVVTVAIGTDAGGAIPSQDGLLLDGRGRPVHSRRHPEALAELARAAGGESLLTDDFGQVPTASVLEALRRGARPAADGWLEQDVPVARSRWPAAAALLLLLAECARLRRGQRAPQALRTRGMHAAAAAVASLVLVGAGGDGRSSGRQGSAAHDLADLERQLRRTPDDAHLLLRVGVARANEGSLREAERAFRAAAVRASEPRLAALAHYDLGVALLHRGHYEGARDAFFDALAVDPNDAYARFNLEWTLRAIAARPQGAGTDEGEEEQPDPSEPESEASASAEDERALPRPAPDPGPDPEEQPDPTPAETRSRTAPPLDAQTAGRWLEQVQDDPARALRATAREGLAPEEKSGPSW